MGGRGDCSRRWVALIRAAPSLANLRVSENEKVGVRIVQKALEEPLRWIAANAGSDGSVVLDKVKNGNRLKPRRWFELAWKHFASR